MDWFNSSPKPTEAGPQTLKLQVYFVSIFLTLHFSQKYLISTNSFCTFMYFDQRSVKKNCFCGNYSRKYGRWRARFWDFKWLDLKQAHHMFSRNFDREDSTSNYEGQLISKIAFCQFQFSQKLNEKSSSSSLWNNWRYFKTSRNHLVFRNHFFSRSFCQPTYF